MAVKKDGQKSKRRLSQAVHSKTRRLRAVAAKSEPAHIPATHAHGLRPDSQPSRFAAEFVADTASDKADNLPSVMLVITILVVIYLVFIAWQVALMPVR